MVKNEKKITWMATFEGSTIRKNFDGEIPSKEEFLKFHRILGDAFLTFYGFNEAGEKKEKEAINLFFIEKEKMEKILGFSFDFKADTNWFEIINN